MQKANKEAATLKKNSNICNKANKRVERYFTDIRSLQLEFISRRFLKLKRMIAPVDQCVKILTLYGTANFIVNIVLPTRKYCTFYRRPDASWPCIHWKQCFDEITEM
ncbi:hypothetical protein T12_11551 [Trichinella patagoniensis]|uniref:Uncharacterized protein n=1 Tax=Trichinella patagoniensis TaxID=990121 RepID=A0A0V0ZF25_9BILA|nr:hypothetical protein T12_11551 [Trichinella patagoniensis]